MVFRKSKTFAKRILLKVFKILKMKSIESQFSYLKKIKTSFPIVLDNFSLESNFS